MPVPIGKIGFITNEGVREPYVFVQGDLHDAADYLILMSSTHDFASGHGFDDWILAENLEGYFEETGWTIEWEPGPWRATPRTPPIEASEETSGGV